MRGTHPNFRIAQAAKDSPIRTLVEAQAVAHEDVLRLRSDFASADTWVWRTLDFPAGNALTALNATTEVTLNPGGQSASGLYDVRYSVTMNVVVPGVGVNNHHLSVALEVDVTGGGSWVFLCSWEYDVSKKVGETNKPVVWPIERLVGNVTGLSTSSKLRLKIKEASGPGGFSVHGFNVATDGDPNLGAKSVVSSSVANPSVITTTEDHIFTTGDLARISGHSGSTPSINGVHEITVTGGKTFTIPVNVTVGGSGGSAQPVIPGVRFHNGPAIALQDANGVVLA